MNRRLFFTHTFCFLLLAQPGMSIAMDTLSAAEQQELAQVMNEVANIDVDQLIAESNAQARNADPGSQPNQLDQLTHLPGWARYALESAQSGLAKAKQIATNIQKERVHAKWQNTVVLAHPKVPVALYKRDLVELPFLAGDIALAYWFFHTFKQSRIKHIKTKLIDNVDWHIEKLEQLEQLDKKVVEAYQQNMADTMAAYKPLKEEHRAIWQEILDEHHYLGHNPFKREIIIPFLSAIVGHKASRYAQSKLLVKQSFVPEAFFAYNPDGTPFNLDESWQPNVTTVQKNIANVKAKKPNTYYKLQEQNCYGQFQDMENPPFDPGILTNKTVSEISKSQDPLLEDIEYIKIDNNTFSTFKNSQNPLRIEKYTKPQEAKDQAAAAVQAGNTILWESFKGLFFWSGAPLATSTALKKVFVSNPNAPSLDYGPPIEKIAGTIGEGIEMAIPEEAVTRAWYNFLGLPSWFYGVKNSAPARYALEIAIMCGALFVANAAYQEDWAKLMHEETTQLRSLLYAYKATQHLPDTDKDKKKVLKDLETFISKGNNVTSLGIKSAVTELFKIQDMGKININVKVTAWMLTITNVLLLCKMRHLRHAWPYAKLGWNAGLIKPQEALIGAAVTAYVAWYPALLYSIVSATLANHVVEDIKTIAGSIKKFFKRRSNKKQEELEEKNDPTETTEVINMNESNDN